MELIDTCLLDLRGKPTPFLHVYHHSATLVLCWTNIVWQSCVQWVPIVINLGVHVMMYLYYGLQALRVDCWWKRYLTMLQIVQFVVGVVACVAVLSSRVAAVFGVPGALPCHGHTYGAFFGIGILLSYLYLFIVFFRATYKPKAKEQ